MAAIRIFGRVALVTLFIFTLVAVALAQDNGTQTPAVVVDDQISTNNTVTVRQVTAPQAAFLVIQRDLAGVPGPVIGQSPVPVGTAENVIVPLTEAVAPGNILYAALYIDAGQVGIFEVPGADAPVVLNDQTLAQPFTIAAASGEEQATPGQPPLSPVATLTPTIAVSPTVALLPTVAVTPTVAATVSPTVETPTIETQPQGQQVVVTPTVQPTVEELQAPATPTVQPQEQAATATVQPTPTAIVAVQATVSAAATPAQPQQREPGQPTPASMPVTGAHGTAKLPMTLLFGVVAFVLVVGGHSCLQRLRSK